VLPGRKIYYAAILVLSIHFSATSQFYTGSQMEFGKNRVQYTPFNWTYYDFTAYRVYFYMGGDKVAGYVGSRAKEIINELSAVMDYQLQNSIDFILYNKESEYAQSNIGLGTDDQYNTGGMNKIVGHKVILYFEGDHQKLDEQIRLGVAQVLFNEMMYGGSFSNVIRSSTLLNIPPWFEQGFVYYAAKGWDAQTDNHVRDGIESGRYKKFNHLTGMDATYAGMSIWNYIAQTYGETVIPNLLYLTRTSRSVESAFVFVLGSSLKSLSADWLSYYNAQYKKEKTAEILPKTSPILPKPKAARTYYQLHASPDGRYVVYSTNELGQMKVWLYDFQTHKRKRILKQGHKINRIIDYSYPLTAWHPTSQLFSIILEEKGKLMLYTYTLADKKLESRRIVNFSKILDFSYSDDGTKFAMSAVQDGQSDIYVFTAASNAFEQITKDVYDDLNPRFIDHSNKIIFSSNRPDDTLRNGGDYHKMQRHHDIFEYDYAGHSNVLRQITNTPDADETYPMGYSGDYVSYLSNASGVVNRYIAHVDSTISFVDTAAHYRYVVHSYPITDYARNIVEQDAPNGLRNITQIIFYKGKYLMYRDTLSTYVGSYIPTTPANTTYMAAQLMNEKRKQRNDSLAAIAKKDTTTILIKYPPVVTAPNVVATTPAPDTSKKKTDSLKNSSGNQPVDINDYSFDNDKPQIKVTVINAVTPTVVQQQPKPATPARDTVKHDSNSGRRHVLEKNDYHVSFSPDFVLAQLDDTYLNLAYQPYTGGGAPLYTNSGLNAFFRVGMSDLFEDYRIDGGVRLSFDLANNEYYLSYEDLSKRLDKQLLLHRVANSYDIDLPSGISTGDVLKTFTYDVNYTIKWPFSEVARIEGTAGMRADKYVVKSSDIPSLEFPDEISLTPNAEIAYVYDATIPVELNINYGFRGKIFAQYYRNMGGAPDWNQGLSSANIYILGADARYYQKISRDLIWANRIAGGTSFGQEKLLYYLGGVDGWISPQFNNNINISQTETYAYQTLATPLRGFDQNIRNGSNFVVFNSELRFPIFHYLLNRPIKSDFFNNFQIIGFFDAGSAWTGLSPYSNENSLNETVVGAKGNPITVILSTQQDPFVEGFGGGLRTRILGYYVRLDDAWGINNGVINTSPVTYISFSLDF